MRVSPVKVRPTYNRVRPTVSRVRPTVSQVRLQRRSSSPHHQASVSFCCQPNSLKKIAIFVIDLRVLSNGVSEQGAQRQSIGWPVWTAMRYSCCDMPVWHVRCCHCWQSSHCKPSWRARTGSVQKMQRGNPRGKAKRPKTSSRSPANAEKQVCPSISIKV